MKFDKLFKKIEKFFTIDDEKLKEEKRAKLLLSLEDKIESLKSKVSDASSKSKKTKLKKQLEVLKELKDKL